MTFPWMLSSRRGRGKGAYQRLMPISNSCPSWTSHFLTALTVKFTSRLNATKEYGGWRVNDSSVMRKERHSFSHSPPPDPLFHQGGDFHNMGAFYFFLPSYTCAMFQWWRGLPVNLVWVRVSSAGNGLSRERVMTDSSFFGGCCGTANAPTAFRCESDVDKNAHKGNELCIFSTHPRPLTVVGVGVVVMVGVKALTTTAEKKKSRYGRIWSRNNKSKYFLLFCCNADG